MIDRGALKIPVALALFFVLSDSASGADELAYRWQEGQKFSYDVEIVVGSENDGTLYKGATHYTVNRSNDTQSEITYRGGLRETKKQPRRSSTGFGRPGFGPRGFGPPSFPRIPSPFSRPTFAGKTQTTNRVTLSARGDVLKMQGDSQLPYLLGNVSVLPFEPLPQDDQNQWTIDSGISITESDEESRQPFGPFGPRGPFSGRDDSKNVQAAREVSKYVVRDRNDGKLTVGKTYQLTAPEVDGTRFEMKGGGTWTFDVAERIPHAYSMKIDLKVVKGSSTTTVPIHIKYDRIDPKKLAEMEALAKKQAEERAKAAADKKAKAEAPLTADETREALAALRSSDSEEIHKMLGSLAEKSVKEPDPKIADAIAGLLQHSDKKVADAAVKALVKWSPEFATKKSLEKAYRGPSPVKSTDLYVESTTPLFVGQIVQAQRARRGTFWRPARIKKLLPDGRVELAFLTWGEERKNDSEVVGRRSIQLAPPELEQPERPRSMPVRRSTVTTSPSSDMNNTRLWTDATGRFKVEAAFVKVDGGKVHLKRTDGKTLVIPVDKLSKEDQAHVHDLQTQSENPFELID